MDVSVNYVALVLAAVASLILGFVWYSKMLFGTPWMKEMGLSSDSMKKAQKELGKLYGLSFVVSIVTAYVLSHVMTLSMSYFNTSPLTTALNTSFWMWLGFMMPVQLTGEIFGGKNWKLLAINTGYQLVSLVLMGVVIALL
jgi:hypothetical protein